MMVDFQEAAFACLEDCSEELRTCLSNIIVKGFKKVPLTPFFKEAVGESFNIAGQLPKLSDEEIIRLGLESLGEPEIRDAFRFHAELVDRYWAKLSSQVA